MRTPKRLLVTVTLSAVTVVSGRAAEFRGLGDLPGGAVDSLATALSADGRVVVGKSNVGSVNRPDYRVYRWTADTGMQELDLLDEKSPFPR